MSPAEEVAHAVRLRAGVTLFAGWLSDRPGRGLPPEFDVAPPPPGVEAGPPPPMAAAALAVLGGADLVVTVRTWGPGPATVAVLGVLGDLAASLARQDQPDAEVLVGLLPRGHAPAEVGGWAPEPAEEAGSTPPGCGLQLLAAAGRPGPVLLSRTFQVTTTGWWQVQPDGAPVPPDDRALPALADELAVTVAELLGLAEPEARC